MRPAGVEFLPGRRPQHRRQLCLTTNALGFYESNREIGANFGGTAEIEAWFGDVDDAILTVELGGGHLQDPAQQGTHHMTNYRRHRYERRGNIQKMYGNTPLGGCARGSLFVPSCPPPPPVLHGLWGASWHRRPVLAGVEMISSP